LRLAITDIQLREVQAHVAEQVRKVKRLARALEAGAGKRSVRSNQDESRDGGVPLPNLLKHNIVKAALAGLDQAADAVMKSFEDLMDRGTLYIIESGHVVASRIFSKYFANEPPFSTGRKKDEFADAFAIEAIRDRAAHLSGTQMVVVSNDNDWLEALGDDDSIVFRQTIAEALQHIRKLDDAGRLIRRAGSSAMIHHPNARSA
jgi:PIN domain-containing protein